MILTIDPGYAKDGKGCACALFSYQGGALVGVRFARPETWLPWDGVTTVIVEQPQQDGRSYDSPPEVLMRLSWDGALLAGLYAGAAGADVVAVTPSDWKGSVPKPVQHVKLWGVLRAAERALLGGKATEAVILAARKKGALERWKKPGGAYYPRSFHAHNLLDAVAMGAVHFGRLEAPR